MSAGQLMKLVVRMALERGGYQTDLTQTAAATREAMTSMQRQADAAGKGVEKGMDVAARGLGGTSIAFTGLAVAAATAYRAVSEAQAEHLELVKAIVTTGNVAGVTTGQLHDMAATIAGSVGTQREAAKALAELARSGEIAGGALLQYAELSVRMERTLGQSIATTAKHFEELGRAPVQASVKLNEQFHYLTAATYAQIKAAELLGRTEDAAALAQSAYARAQAQRVAEVEQNLGYIERAWRAVGDAAKWAWDKMLNLGRESGSGDKLSGLRQQLEQVERNLNDTGPNKWFRMPQKQAQMEAEAESLREQIRLLGRASSAEQQRARERGEWVKANDAAIAAMDAVDKVNQKALSRQEQLNAALKIYRENLDAIRKVNPNDERLSAASVARGESAIRSQYADRSTRDRPRAEPRDLDNQAQALANYVAGLGRAIEKTEELSEVEKARNFLKSLGATGESEQVRELVLGMAQQVDAAKALAEAEKDATRAAQEGERARKALLQEGSAVYDATRTPLERLNIEQARLNELLRQGVIDWDTYSRAVFASQDAYDSAIKASDDAGRKLDTFGKTAAKNVQSAMGDALYNVMNGKFDNIAQGFTNMLNRMVSEAIAADLSRKMFGGMVQGGSGEGWIGAGLKWLGGLLSFDGGGHTPFAARSGGLDGKGGFLAIMHPQEKVTDLTKPGSSEVGAATVVKQYNLTVAAPKGGTRETALQWGRDAMRGLITSESRNG